MVKSHNFSLHIAGQNLPAKRKEELSNIIKRCLRHKMGPETIGRFLAREVQAMDNVTVGKTVMCTFVPKVHSDVVGLHSGAVLMENPVSSSEPQILKPAKFVSLHNRFTLIPPFDGPRYVYISEDNKSYPYYSPILVNPGLPGGVIQMDFGEISITAPPFVQRSTP